MAVFCTGGDRDLPALITGDRADTRCPVFQLGAALGLSLIKIQKVDLVENENY
jgi:hypothetical protein